MIHPADLEIVEPAVRAPTDNNLLDGRPGDVSHRPDIVDGVGTGDLGAERPDVDRDTLLYDAPGSALT